MKILAIETSCDETAAAVVQDGRTICSSVVATQLAEHRLYGGVVPEIASRRHCESICEVTEQALFEADMGFFDVDAIAVTHAPGLIGALLVGVNYAKALSFSLQKPLVAVHHLRSHIAANYLSHQNLTPPFLGLIISGGHTHIVHVKDYTDYTVLARTRDDAAGEAFDKAARALGYPYPGGAEIDLAAKKGNQCAYRLPRPKVEGFPYDFSFSGLKTAVLNEINRAKSKGEQLCREDLAASFELAVCDLLSDRVIRLLKETQEDKLVVAGGVSANTGIRARLKEECRALGVELFLPPLSLCGDNAAMVGAQAYYEMRSGARADLSLNAVASLSIEKTP